MWPSRSTAIPAAEADAVAGVRDGLGRSDRVRPAVALFLGASAMFANPNRTGVVARYVDASNYLEASVRHDSALSPVEVRKRVAGVITSLGEVDAPLPAATR